MPSSDGVEVNVRDFGGSGAPLLVAHANGFLAAVYAELAAELADRFHVWALDFRAHGDATRPASGELEWGGFADDVEAVLDALGLEQPFGFGHSMGGAALAMTQQRRPGTFRALYLFEPVLVPVGAFPVSDDNPMAAAARRRRPSFPTRAEAVANYAAKPPLDELTTEALRLYVEEGFAEADDGSVHLKCRPEDEAEIFRVGGRNGAFARLGELALPVTVARGAPTPGPALFAEQQVAALPHGRLEELGGLGHFGPLQDPARVARSVVAALLGG